MLRHRLSRWGCSFAVVGLLVSCASNALAAHVPGQSQLGGWVYIDRNNDGQLAFSNDPNPEYVIGGVVINLYKVVAGVQQPAPYMATSSDDFGRYVFDNIDPGTYNMYEMQPVAYVDGKDGLGSLIQLGSTPIPPGDSKGTVVTNKPLPGQLGGAFLNMVLSANIGGEFYNFGQRGLAAGYVSKKYLLASSPALNTAAPEPTTLMIALIGGFGVFCNRRSRSSNS